MRNYKEVMYQLQNDQSGRQKEQREKKLKEIRVGGCLLSILLGLEVQAIFYYVFGINPLYVPIFAVVILWTVNTILVGCVVDEFIKRKYKIRLYKSFELNC